MRYVARDIEGVVLGAARHLPAVVLTGPRRAGKTTLLRHLFPRARYVLLENRDTRARVRSDPRAFLDELQPSDRPWPLPSCRCNGPCRGRRASSSFTGGPSYPS